MSDRPPLHIKRTLNASRQAVWDAWTQPDQFKQWYMPAPFSVPSCELDVRPGGHAEIDTQSPDGAIMHLTGEYQIVEELSKLVMTNSPLGPDGKPLFQIRHTLLLTEAGGQTILDLTAEVLSAGPEAEPFLAGMEPGLNQALDQLASLVD